MIVATHNLMHGRRLSDLMPHYHALHDERGLDVLCVQENRDDAGRSHSPRIAGSLGPHFAELSNARICGKGLIYRKSRLTCLEHRLVKLPALSRLGWLERRYIAGGQPEQRYVQFARFEDRKGGIVTVVNFHLDTAGGNAHRNQQVAAIAQLLGPRPGKVVACGDTNAFSLRHRNQPRVLSSMLAPLSKLGLDWAPNGAPTHHFGRQHEPLLTHRMLARLGKLGFDLPQQYDVVGANCRVEGRGTRETRGSDHDLVWAAVGS